MFVHLKKSWLYKVIVIMSLQGDIIYCRKFYITF